MKFKRYIFGSTSWLKISENFSSNLWINSTLTTLTKYIKVFVRVQLNFLSLAAKYFTLDYAKKLDFSNYLFYFYLNI